MSTFLGILAEALTTPTTTVSSKSRADEFIELVRNDNFRYTHRDEYLAMFKYLDGFDQQVVLLKLRGINVCLWAYIKDNA